MGNVRNVLKRGKKLGKDLLRNGRNTLQVNIFQKHLFSHQLTHNINDKTLFIDLPVQYMKTKSSEQFVYTTCSGKSMNIVLSFILWVSWCENKCFWQRFIYLFVKKSIRKKWQNREKLQFYRKTFECIEFKYHQKS